jgi:NAD-dependent deacetylase
MDRLRSIEAASPNAGHRALATLAGQVPRFTLVTQNVDDLHERAGSQQVLHIHGRITRFRCNRCAYEHPLPKGERHGTEPPVCGVCGAHVRPDVVWFGENLPGRVLDAAWWAAERCDVILVVGTSGVVYPVAQLPLVAQQHGATLIDINPDCTPSSEIADLFLQGAGGVILPALLAAMKMSR